MAFEQKNFVRISAASTANDQPGAINFTYESFDDDLADMEADGYFDSVRHLLRQGSVIQAISSSDEIPPADDPTYVFLQVIAPSNGMEPEGEVKTQKLSIVPAPPTMYQTMGEAPLSYVTSGGNTDIVPFPESEVGFYATYSLNSAINDIGPPLAHSGIEFIECQAGQLLIDYSRPVIAGQTVLLWVQLKSATPLP